MSETEFAMLVLGVGVLAVAAMRFRSVYRLRYWQLLAAAYFCLLAGWAATTLEEFFQHSFFNWLEHAAYACGAILAAVWAWLGPRNLKEVA